MEDDSQEAEKDASKKLFGAIKSAIGMIRALQLVQGNIEVLDEAEPDLVRELRAVVGSKRNIESFLNALLKDISRGMDEENLPEAVKNRIIPGHKITETTLRTAKVQIGNLLRIVLSKRYEKRQELIMRKWITTFVGVLVPELSLHFQDEEEESVFFALEHIIRAVSLSFPFPFFFLSQSVDC